MDARVYGALTGVSEAAVGKLLSGIKVFKGVVNAGRGDVRANAVYGTKDGRGVITIALDAKNPIKTAAVHEAVHALKESDPAAYEDLRRTVADALKSDDYAGYLSTIKEYAALYENDAVRDFADVSEEITADAAGAVSENPDILSRLTEQNPGAWARLKDWINDTRLRIRGTLRKDAELTATQKDRFKSLDRNISGIADKLETALRNAEGKTREATGETEKFSMYKSKTENFGDFYDFVLENRSNPAEVNKSYFDYKTEAGKTVRVPFDAVLHIVDGHELKPGDFETMLNALDTGSKKAVGGNGSYGGRSEAHKVKVGAETAGILLETFDKKPPILRTAFFGGENSVDNWVNKTEKNGFAALETGKSDSALFLDDNRSSDTSIAQTNEKVKGNFSLTPIETVEARRYQVAHNQRRHSKSAPSLNLNQHLR